MQLNKQRQVLVVINSLRFVSCTLVAMQIIERVTFALFSSVSQKREIWATALLHSGV